ncbi:Dnaj homolog subfamily c member 10-like [Plakobranchus ocellatus]|uniref:Dnaj homolog subfamily c member 10-like n=1 Tax=Plakobranchus ocellatus TaxID=259542 RepID=A0AAV4AGL9_9GAST|nr:Dnaj homolog subfamily c member 10-like [Plakobranchus ocellatus]
MLSELVNVGSIDCYKEESLCTKLGHQHGTFYYKAGEVNKDSGMQPRSSFHSESRLMEKSLEIHFVNRSSGQPCDVSLKKNRWKWKWLQQKDDNDEYFSVYIRKVKDVGLAWCCYCHKSINYAKAGKIALMRHSKKACHKEKRKLMRENQSLPAAFETTQQKIDGVAIHPGHGALPYGCAPNVQLPSCERQPSTGEDFNLSADLREDLATICTCMEHPELVPLERAGHRWMSVLTSSTRFLDLLAPLTIFYSAWLTAEERKVFESNSTALLKKIQKQDRLQIYVVISRLRKKGLTALGKQIKRRIIKKLFDQRQTVLSIAHTDTSILPKFNKFIKMFEKEEPLVHKIHDELILVLKHFLSAYMKHEELNANEARLHKLDLKNEELFLKPDQVFIGEDTVKVFEKKNDLSSFQKHALSVYQKTGQYLQSKLPINNKVLATLSTIDPCLAGHSAACAGLRELHKTFSRFVTSPTDSFSDAASALHLDSALHRGLDKVQRLDAWWGKVLQHDQYAPLKPALHACLSIFRGPRVESSFSVMNSIITSTTNRMHIKTYEAVHKIKYSLISRNTSSISFSSTERVLFTHQLTYL